MSSLTQNPYDEVPYTSLPVRRTHPSHLATIARLFGLKPTPPGRSRVLELGCASGGNLLPLAVDFVHSEFVGVDSSPRQIEMGRAAVNELGLRNIHLHDLDLRNVDEGFGTFDYILCHGVYSWVERAVQDRILEIGHSLLAENGILFVSYNTFPGWHLRGVVRDMMAFHVRDLKEPATKIAQARALLDFLVDSATGTGEAYRCLLRDESVILKSHDDSYLYHEHLEDVNEPLYFYEFVERAARSGLQYLGDTDLSSQLPSELETNAARLLENASLLQQEQYLDFLRNRMFRGSLLCHREVSLQRYLDSKHLTDCDIGLETSLPLPPRRADASLLVCDSPAGRIRVKGRLAQAALYLLNEAWPGCIPFANLFQQSLRLVAETPLLESQEQQRHSLARDALTLYLQKLVRAWDEAPACLAQGGEFPLTTRLARWQAARGYLVTNRRHEALQISDLEAFLLARLNGQRDRAALEAALTAGIQSGAWTFQNKSGALTRFEDDTLSSLIDRTLDDLARQALLIPETEESCAS